jgi:hypothetical protein
MHEWWVVILQQQVWLPGLGTEDDPPPDHQTTARL